MKPPWPARLLLLLLIRAADREFILGDIDEEFSQRASGAAAGAGARRWYWRQAIGSVWAYRRGRPRSEAAASQPHNFPKPAGDPLMDTLINDVRYALRSLARQPGFALAALLTLSLGIGANTAIFSVVNGVLLSPLPYPASERLLMLWQRNLETGRRHTASAPNYLDWKEQSSSFQAMYAFTITQFTVKVGDSRERALAGQVTSGFQAVTGVEPQLGRGFEPRDEAAGAAPVVILSNAFWQRHYGRSPSVLGRMLETDGVSRQIVGVMPAGFVMPLGSSEQFWVPLGQDQLDVDRSMFYLRVVARLAEGVGFDQAREEMQRIWEGICLQYPAETTNRGMAVVGLKDEIVEDVQVPLLVLLGAVGLVLLMACANVANLLLARTARRAPEIAVRTALGASRRRLLRQLLSESLVLSVAAGLLGIGLAAAGLEALTALSPPNLPRLEQVSLNIPVLGFTLLLTLASAVAFGTLPAFYAARKDPADSIGSGARTTLGSRRQGWTRNVLVAAQLAIALVLLIGAGLLIRSFTQLMQANPGFDPRNVLTAAILLPNEVYREREDRTRVYQRLLERLGSLPGVESAGGIWAAPMEASRIGYSLRIGGKPIPPPGQSPGAELRIATGGYFKSLGIPLLKGRTFDWSDGLDSPKVVLVSRLLAEEFWPDEDPIGKDLALLPRTPDDPVEWRTVIGVVGDVKLTGLDDIERGLLYLPYSQSPQFSIVATLRTSIPPRELAASVRAAVAEVGPEIPSPRIDSMESRLESTLSQRRFAMLLLAVFAALALALASVGVYGVLAYMVSLRRGEIGLRLALGASRGRILAMVARQGMLLALAGIGVGLAAALALSQTLSSLVYSISVTDPATFVALSLLMALISLTACTLPAWRAARIDPVKTLKQE